MLPALGRTIRCTTARMQQAGLPRTGLQVPPRRQLNSVTCGRGLLFLRSTRNRRASTGPACSFHQRHAWLRSRRRDVPCLGLAKAERSTRWNGTARTAQSTVEAPTEEAASSSRAQLPKNFDPAGEESRYKWWESNGYFQPRDPSECADQEPFVVPMPPPNVTGRLHMGHAMFVTLQDIMVRFARMQGRPTLWLPGTDHAGIATQLVVENQLAAQGDSRKGLGREAFEARVWEWKAEYGGFITQQLRRLGASCDWTRERFTLDAGLSAAVAEAFVRLHEKGLIYRGSYMVNWAPKLQTAVSDLEVEYRTRPGTMYYFRYPVADSDSDEFLPVATTRPETILGDTAVAVHPEDERYRHLVGRECRVPMLDRRIRIIADEYVDREFGTGALKITPGHDPNDYEIGKRAGLDIINIMNDDGSLNAAAGRYAGLTREAARKQLWADLQEADLAIKEEPHEMRVPFSQRGGEVVEPLVRDQWFVRMQPLAQPALKAVADGEIQIVPDHFEKIYNAWLEDIKDWCISRQLWWGHRIPVWYVFPDQQAAEASTSGRSDAFVVARSEQDAYSDARQQYGETAVLVQETDVLDTWFSSGLWPFSTVGWPDDGAADLASFYPASVLETGHDILFFWVARMVMLGIEFTGKPPFKTILLHGLVRDAQGRKMSKSIGNVVDPVETIEQYGTDALRFTLATGGTMGQDLNLSMERVLANRNFTNKLWNAGKFILFQLEQVDDAEFERLAAADFTSEASTSGLPLAERWIVSALHQVVAASTRAHERLEFGEAGRLLYDFLWSDFADWYIEASKTRMYSGEAGAAAAARQVLVYVFDTVLRLAHPFMPFITEELWQALPHDGEALVMAPWPSTSGAIDAAAVQQFEALQAVARAVRNARAEYGVEPGRKIAASVVVRADEALREALASEAAVICLLAKLDPAGLTVTGGTTAAGGEGQIALVVQEGLEVLLPMAGLFDAQKEIDRLGKQRAKIEKELAGLNGRLSNPSFVERAKAGVVDEVRRQQVEAEEQLAMVDQKLAQFRELAASP